MLISRSLLKWKVQIFSVFTANKVMSLLVSGENFRPGIKIILTWKDDIGIDFLERLEK